MLEIRSPTSPKSWVRTLARAASEKSAIFFWVPAPYCRIWAVFSTSIFAAKASTICCSSAVSTGSATFTAVSSFTAMGMGAASSSGSRVRLGAMLSN